MSAPTAADAATASPDVLAKYQEQLLAVIVAFGDEVLDCVRDSKGIQVEDVRRDLLAPIRAAAAATAAVARASQGGPDQG